MSPPPSDGDESPRPPMITPIPTSDDRRIDMHSIDLARCRPDLSPEQQHMLARSLAYRCRAFRKDQSPAGQ